MSLPTINICFSTETGWFWRLVRWVTKAKVSHVLLTFRDATLGKVLALQTDGRGFMPLPWSRWRRRHSMVARFALRIPEDRQVTALQTLVDRLSDEHDQMGWWSAWRRRWHKRNLNLLASPTRLLCAELVVRYLQLCGLPAQTPDLYEPADVFMLLSKSKHAVRLM